MTAPGQLAALGEPSRWRIVELLGDGPLPVGEIADRLGARQPQATKHLQVLERAGLVVAHPLGRRKLYALDREVMSRLGSRLTELAAPAESDRLRAEYSAAIDREEVRLRRTPGRGRIVRRQKLIAAAPGQVFAAWTAPHMLRSWWHPAGFVVAECVARPEPGGEFRVVLAEGDGARHTAAGEFLTVRAPELIEFRMDPLDPLGRPYFRARYRVLLAAEAGQTSVRLVITVTDIAPEAAPVVAGLELGWRQLLDQLAGMFS